MTQQLTPKEKQEVQNQEQTRPGRSYVPAVDIWEDAEGLRLRADVPGVNPAHVSVELDDDLLSFESHVDLSDYAGLTPVYTEYNVGHFKRRFTIPAGARYDCDAVQARVTDGVLEIVMPRAEAAKPQRIAVTGA